MNIEDLIRAVNPVRPGDLEDALSRARSTRWPASSNRTPPPASRTAARRAHTAVPSPRACIPATARPFRPGGGN